MTREERKEQADMRDEYYRMEERVAALEDERDELLEALKKASKALHYELTIGDHNAITRMVDNALQEAEG